MILKIQDDVRIRLPFINLDIGEVFSVEERYYLKIHPIECGNMIYNAVSLNDHYAVSFPTTELCNDVSATLKVYEVGSNET